jgi:hypothetical protein
MHKTVLLAKEKQDKEDHRYRDDKISRMSFILLHKGDKIAA